MRALVLIHRRTRREDLHAPGRQAGRLGVEQLEAARTEADQRKAFISVGTAASGRIHLFVPSLPWDLQVFSAHPALSRVSRQNFRRRHSCHCGSWPRDAGTAMPAGPQRAARPVPGQSTKLPLTACSPRRKLAPEHGYCDVVRAAAAAPRLDSAEGRIWVLNSKPQHAVQRKL